MSTDRTSLDAQHLDESTRASYMSQTQSRLSVQIACKLVWHILAINERSTISCMSHQGSNDGHLHVDRTFCEIVILHQSMLDKAELRVATCHVIG